MNIGPDPKRKPDPTRNFAVGRSRATEVDDEIVEDVEDIEDSTRACRPSERGAIEITDEIIDRFRDIMIIKLRRKNISLRNIAKILNVSHETIRLRIEAIPGEVKAYYERVELA